ncbi:hypothetical protein NA8A_04818 [Nitratireductor indicus C115]|uniref:Uncharacterized protein n=1 Tax=Nitratireductor indicus C115 TaxID=1231190 RepID=K2NVG6_9HYPH|nr:hypothetical protein [Nitratireductor indicus]EKF43325.1 hypothetical protein NA8A_04818 [Nitratireductor indicus C115]SFQ09998.1 hypothetical protein SAMN05216176_101341 [Nitratireductor indicus]
MSNEPSHGVEPTPQIAAADDPANAGAPPAADPTQGGRTEPIGGADGQMPGIYKPEGIADHLVGQTNEETIDRLIRENKGFRDAQAKKTGAVPENADGYQPFEWGEKTKALGGVADDDQALGIFKNIAHEHGFTDAQMAAVPKFMEAMAEKGLLEAPFDTAGMLESLAPEGFKGSAEEKQAKGGERLTAAENWIKQLDAEAHGFDQDMKNEMRLLTTSLAGVKVIEKLMNRGVNPSVHPGGGGAERAVTKQDYEARIADPRNNAFGDKFDENFANETREIARRLFGD